MGMHETCDWCNGSKDWGDRTNLVFEGLVCREFCSKRCKEAYIANKKSKKKAKKSKSSSSGSDNGFLANAIAVLIMISLVVSALKWIYTFLVIDTQSASISWGIATIITALYIHKVQLSFRFTRVSTPLYLILIVWGGLILRYLQ